MHKLLISWTFLAISMQTFSKPTNYWFSAALSSLSQVGDFHALFFDLPCLVLYVDLPFNDFEGCLVVLTQYVSNPLSENKEKQNSKRRFKVLYLITILYVCQMWDRIWSLQRLNLWFWLVKNDQAMMRKHYTNNELGTQPYQCSTSWVDHKCQYAY